MPQKTGLVGLDVSKRKIDACIRGLDLHFSAPSTPEGQAKMIAWLRANGVGAAVMEASGGYERSWAEALRRAGLAVRIVDPKRVRYFARSAGRLAKNDPIDAAMIAWFAETFVEAAGQPHDPEREALDRLVTARATLLKLLTAIANQGEHRQPRVVAKAHAAIIKTVRAQLARLEAAVAAAIAANRGFARCAEIIASVPGLADQTAAGVIAWLPELGRVSDKAATALVACMRKLIVILNTMLARDQTWNPPARAAA